MAANTTNNTMFPTATNDRTAELEVDERITVEQYLNRLLEVYAQRLMRHAEQRTQEFKEQAARARLEIVQAFES